MPLKIKFENIEYIIRWIKMLVEPDLKKKNHKNNSEPVIYYEIKHSNIVI